MAPTINLVDYRMVRRSFMAPGDPPFLIESMKNTIEFATGTYLYERDILGLIKRGWTVNIRGTKDSDY